MSCRYLILSRGGPFRDLGVNYFEDRDADHMRRWLVRRLEAMGIKLTLVPLIHAGGNAPLAPCGEAAGTGPGA